ncbi:MAG: flagellar basal body L-ring protein FlgH [Proteobacteria bacterium]|jgi:flagellar L-ring protein precursor FlgH|nr:flagellar basal body L-ring protein FlgH [Pseudomonadota bacterium]MDA0850168.1 flagellar basal body L-ring protein FlgH [Pseudomonadota bacterium]NCW55411.1 flagellar basal body L-ring protein FlgH [Paracoccaceae bacterium]
MRLTYIITLFYALLLSACSTYVEDVASEQFMPVIPDETEQERIVDGAIYSGKSKGLFATERKASKVGDIVTVALNESFNASKSQSAATGKTDSFGVTLPTGLLTDLVGKSAKAADYGFGSTQAFNGTGTASQSNAITGLVSASVVRVFDNGNLEVLGQKKLTLNNGDEYVRVRGMVRPQDIGAGNIVNSNRLANAEITYIGAGEVADTAKRGWLSRLVTVVSPL